MAVQLPNQSSSAPPPFPGAASAPPALPAQPPHAAELLDPNDEPIEPHVSFWQEPWVQNALPFATSLIIHVTLILMGFLLIKPLMKGQDVSQEQVFIPDASIVE